MDLLIEKLYDAAAFRPLWSVAESISGDQRPISLVRVRQNVASNAYAGDVKLFLRDLAQVVHNAQQVSEPNSATYVAAMQLDKLLKSQTPAPQPVEKVEEYEDDDEEVDDDDEDDDEYGQTPRKRGRPRKELEEGQQEGEPAKRKRGRPPIIRKPFELKIAAILKAAQKARDSKNRVMILAFDRLPNSKQVPEYYERVQNPISLEHICKRIKDRSYGSVDAFVADMDLMLGNARAYYAADTKIHQDAISLERIVHKATAEVQQSDYDLNGANSTPSDGSNLHRGLDSVVVGGENYIVGDWVHIRNPNKGGLPIVGQIQRLWQTSDGRRWLNALWFYRPEQTVHPADKLFFENEVFHSSRFHDHLADDLLGKCYVMYINKYFKGRPKGLDRSRLVYCCESKYNDDDKSFAKIRTWKVCTADGSNVEPDYEMDFFDKPLPVVKVPSPIKQLLPATASASDPMPEPKMGMPNAPPIVGAVYIASTEQWEVPTQRRTGQPAGSPLASQQQAASPAMNSPLGQPQLYRQESGTSSVSSPAPLAPSEMSQIFQQAAIPLPVGRAPLPQPASYTPGIPVSFTLAEHVQSGLPLSELESVAKTRGQMVWFSAPPVWIPERLAVLPQAQEPAANANEDSAISVAQCGHSARYMAWRLARGY